MMAGDVEASWPAVSSVISGVSGGAKLGCVANPFNKISRELIVRREIDSVAALRKIFGVPINLFGVKKRCAGLLSKLLVGPKPLNCCRSLDLLLTRKRQVIGQIVIVNN
jgi:hypothetical protein